MKSSLELKILVAIALLYTIAISQYILFPILLSFLLYLLLSPFMEWLVKIRIPKVIASAFILSGILGIISLGITFIIPPATNWIINASDNFKIIEGKFRTVKSSLGEINKAAESAQSMAGIDQKKNVIVTSNVSLAPSLFNLTTDIVISIGTVVVLLFFYLMYFKSFIQQLELLIYKRKKSSAPENLYILTLKNEVSKYLFTFSIICFCLGLVMALVFWLLNVPNAPLWGAMVAILTFVPYLGHLIGIIIILFVSLITFDTYLQIFAPPVLYFLITVIEGQLITPIFLGRRLKLNPLLIFLTILIWSWLWGFAGAIISVPILVTLKITLEFMPSLSRYAVLLEK
ncbi:MULTISPECIES: AI-2E family transporter [Legionella]|uniref:AI-2E family transporter n=1 Tax=Legionella resiliens TaxID=2905958 RepID=A0ABS8X2K1_9GAMM|nr:MULTISPECIES: AI-2E family transporter [unclassified Legionella]MCE0722818.1 AI-2E family transporter [Legionella sp. 9fVS26]MCE3531971.1 AI-2E family transporter [Legionella sp. 8cVS16]QLZ68086.1 Putative transport protein YhhT [Legionella sp. PC1000]